MLVENKTSRFPRIIKEHNNDQFFSKRANRLTEINSYHMFQIDYAAIGQSPMYIYRDSDRFNLNQLIEEKAELLPSQIKCIIWQIAKLMLCCEGIKINHLRLYPKSIVLREEYVRSHPIFITVKDFSLGKEFQSVSEGKVQEIFEYLHPNHSIYNQMVNFQEEHSEYDIWSLGIILYKLIYYQNPFYKSGRKIFSKTILREYLADKYVIPFPNRQYENINRFILRCLPNSKSEQRFTSWKDVKRYILEQQQIYHQLDFHDVFFQQMAEIHFKAMLFLTTMYCMIIDQCRESPNPFWKIPASSHNNTPFQVGICEFTLTFMMALEERFKSIYTGHLHLLKKDTLKKLNFMSDRLKAEFKYKDGKWIYHKLRSDKLNGEIIKIIQDICVKLKIEASEENERIEMASIPKEGFDSRRIKEQRSNLVLKKKDSKAAKVVKDRKVWKSVQILYDYCCEVLQIVTASKERLKYIYEQFYQNSIFNTILSEQFHYKKDFSQVFKRVYKDYII